MRKRSFEVLMAAAATAAFGLAACDDGGEPEDGDVCEGLAAACSTEGESRCAGDAVESCAEDAHGCLLWTLTETCAGAGRCAESGSGAACACEDECDAPGASWCDEGRIVTCVADGAGCLTAVQSLDCGDLGGTCDVAAGEASCVAPACEDQCDVEGERSCSGGAIVSCLRAGSGCLELLAIEDCGDEGALCDSSAGAPVCAVPGCGPCDEPGEYCDDSATPPTCVAAGPVREIMAGVSAGTPWSEVDALTRRALAARADLTLAAYREAFGPAALEAAVAAAVSSPTSGMDAAYETFLAVAIGVDSVASEELEGALRALTVLVAFDRQLVAVSYLGTSAEGWDGASPVHWMPMPDDETTGAHQALAESLVTTLRSLLARGALAASDRAAAEAALVLARQVRTGSFGFSFGGDVLETLHGRTGWAWDLLFGYADFGGAYYESDEAFLDQVNAYLHAPLIRIHEGSRVAMAFMEGGYLDPDLVAAVLGDAGESETARLYTLLGEHFRDRVLEHPDIDRPCLSYSREEQARIWDALTADNGADDEGRTTFASFARDFAAFGAAETARLVGAMEAILLDLFPSESAAMSLAERDAILAAVRGAASLGAATDAFYGGLAGAGDGSAPDLLDARMASLTRIGSRDYGDPDHGADWLAEDGATVTALWTDVRGWVLAEYDVDADLLPLEPVVLAEYSGIWADPSGLYVGLLEPATLVQVESGLLAAACASLLPGGGPLEALTAQGATASTEEWVLGRLLEDTLPPSEAAMVPYAAMDDLVLRAYVLGATDAALGQHIGLGCSTGSVLSWIEGVAERWGVPAALHEPMAARSLLGTQYVSYSYAQIAYRGALVSLQTRLDAGLGAAAPRLDPIAIAACGVSRPADDDATYAALVDCLVD